MNPQKQNNNNKPILPEELDVLRPVWESRKRPPITFRMGRDAHLQLAKVKRDLFTDLEEKESGNYIVSGLERSVSNLTLRLSE